MIFKIHRYPEYCIGHGFDGAFCRLIKVIIDKSGFACCAVPSPKKSYVVSVNDIYRLREDDISK